jgi:hypothetical protein
MRPNERAMRQLSALDVVRVCEWGKDKHALDRAVVLLRAASPDADPAALARLSVGSRDALLLALRGRTFGSKLEMLARCPKCNDPLEFATTVEALTLPPPEPGAPARERRFAFDEYEIAYRLPDSYDLAAIATTKDLVTARNALLARCVLGAWRGDETVGAEALPETVRAALASRIAADDPQADITFNLLCPGCKHRFQTVFDVLSYFWVELEAHARQLQREVHALAKAYGWTEAQILGMSAARRARYVELAASG